MICLHQNANSYWSYWKTNLANYGHHLVGFNKKIVDVVASTNIVTWYLDLISKSTIDSMHQPIFNIYIYIYIYSYIYITICISYLLLHSSKMLYPVIWMTLVATWLSFLSANINHGSLVVPWWLRRKDWRNNSNFQMRTTLINITLLFKPCLNSSTNLWDLLATSTNKTETYNMLPKLGGVRICGSPSFCCFLTTQHKHVIHLFSCSFSNSTTKKRWFFQ